MKRMVYFDVFYKKKEEVGKMLGRKGFTLIELVVVMMIVAILAGVGIPMMRGNIAKAKFTEAVAAMGVARTQLLLNYAETGAYDQLPGNAGTISTGSIDNIPGVDSSDFNGTYFSTSDYDLYSIDSGGFVIRVKGANGEVYGKGMTINQSGEVQGPSEAIYNQQ